ncbi:pimeloyl-ACP methyl ester carboxylesterase [Deinococcus metalli]|uniref:Alpha/beta hydrolase n=1 Tax=Deinococcus metalli TaxID=1141878 RepID=A0A7W8KCA5_9DEIO|nr:alpha/beta hydrolase [Deinococcus metalli]MBB5375285.1 pimeloyl-ACP methyl ester carboxylesterase [Deinococcus metalli]GHF30379.1 alpha/beta hydrolase [Deinococcus metalli]
MKVDRIFLDVHGLRTHALVLGRGAPLVVVPGLGCASWMYLRVAAALADDRRVYLYDPPGHGYSQGTASFPTCIEHLTDHLAAWLVQAGLVGTPVFGHSLGGEVTFDLAARYPGFCTAVVACAPTGIPENPSVPVQLLRLLRDLPRERAALLVPGLRAYRHCGVRRMLRLADDQTAHDTGPLLGRVDVPTLLLDGLSDPVIQSWTVQAIRTAIPDAVVREIAGGTHALTDSHPRAVARYTLDFLEAIER